MAKKILAMNSDFRQRAVHTGNDVDSETGAIKRPITMANSYELPYDPSDLNWSSAGKTLHTQRRFKSTVSSGKACVPLRAEGVALFLQAVLQLCRDFSLHCSKSGDHVVFSSVTYIAVYRLLNELLKDKFGVEATIVDTTDIEKVKGSNPSEHKAHSHLKHRATLLFQFPTLKRLQSLPIQTVHFVGWQARLLLRSTKDRLKLGADFTVESLTKYISGHGDHNGRCNHRQKNTSTLSVRSRRLTSAQQSARSMHGWLWEVR